MATHTTATAPRAILPDAVGDLLFEPLREQSVALTVSTVITPNQDSSSFRMPIVATNPAAAWVGEGGEITRDDGDLDEVATTYAKLAALTVMSRELLEDSTPEASNLIGVGIARDIAKKLDAAFFGSTAGAPIPAGLGDLSGVTTTEVDGTAWTDVDAFSDALYLAASVGAKVTAWVANPATAQALSKIKDETGSVRPLLDTDPAAPLRRTIGGIPLFVSPGVEDDTVWGIPQDLSVIAVRQDMRIHIDQSRYFEYDSHAVRATMRVGWVFPHKAALQKIVLTGV